MISLGLHKIVHCIVIQKLLQNVDNSGKKHEFVPSVVTVILYYIHHRDVLVQYLNILQYMSDASTWSDFARMREKREKERKKMTSKCLVDGWKSCDMLSGLLEVFVLSFVFMETSRFSRHIYQKVKIRLTQT